MSLQSIIDSIYPNPTQIPNASEVLKRVTEKRIVKVVFVGLQSIDAFTKTYGGEESARLQLTLERAVAEMRKMASALPQPAQDTLLAKAKYIENYGLKFLLTGIELNTELAQSELDLIIPALGEDLVTKIKELGIKKVSECEQDGIGDTDLQTVTDTITSMNQKRRAGNYWSRVLELINPMLENGETAEKVQAAAAAVSLD